MAKHHHPISLTRSQPDGMQAVPYHEATHHGVRLYEEDGRILVIDIRDWLDITRTLLRRSLRRGSNVHTDSPAWEFVQHVQGMVHVPGGHADGREHYAVPDHTRKRPVGSS